MLNNKRFFIFENKKEQKYLKNLISKINEPEMQKMYSDFEKILSLHDFEDFIKKYHKFIKKNIEINIDKTLNDLKEELAYELIEYIYQKFHS